MQELPRERKSGNIRFCHVNKLTFALVDDVVVTDQIWARLLLANDKLLVRDAVGVHTEPDAKHTRGNEVHFWNFFFFVVDDLVFLI